jgi:hypothetical protein
MTDASWGAMVAQCRAGGVDAVRVLFRAIPGQSKLAFLDMAIKPLLDDDLCEHPALLTGPQAHTLLDEMPELTTAQRAQAHTMLDDILREQTP